MSRYTQNKLVMLLVGALKCVKVNIKTSYARKALKFVLSYVPLLKKFVCFFTLICFHSCVYLIYRLKPVLLQNCAVFITVWPFSNLRIQNDRPLSWYISFYDCLSLYWLSQKYCIVILLAMYRVLYHEVPCDPHPLTFRCCWWKKK